MCLSVASGIAISMGRKSGIIANADAALMQSLMLTVVVFAGDQNDRPNIKMKRDSVP